MGSLRKPMRPCLGSALNYSACPVHREILLKPEKPFFSREPRHSNTQTNKAKAGNGLTLKEMPYFYTSELIALVGMVQRHHSECYLNSVFLCANNVSCLQDHRWHTSRPSTCLAFPADWPTAIRGSHHYQTIS